MNFDPSSLEILSVGGNKNTRGGEHVAWSEIRTSSSTKKKVDSKYPTNAISRSSQTA